MGRPADRQPYFSKLKSERAAFLVLCPFHFSVILDSSELPPHFSEFDEIAESIMSACRAYKGVLLDISVALILKNMHTPTPQSD
jgi:hypothetical protein